MTEHETNPAVPTGRDGWSREELTAVFPWVEHLDDGEFDEFTDDLASWRATAEIHADPDLDNQMQAVLNDMTSEINVWAGLGREPARIDPVLAELRTTWLAAPDLRLGQLLAAAARGRDTFGIEEPAWSTLLREFRDDMMDIHLARSALQVHTDAGEPATTVDDPDKSTETHLPG